MALSSRQVALYIDRVDAWRRTLPATGANSKRTTVGSTWARVAENLACFIERGKSQHVPIAGIGAVESDNMFTFDPIHFEAGANVQSGDVLKVMIGPQAGDYYQARGEPQIRMRHANKQTLLCSRCEAPPEGVP